MSSRRRKPPIRKLWTEENFAEVKRGIIQTAKNRANNPQEMNSAPPASGLLHTEVTAPVVNFNAAPNQLEINTQGAAIIFGSDRPAGLATGYGAQGAQGANTIDIVVGRMSSANGGTGPADGALVEPSFGADAARIYISQKTNIDTNFGIPQPVVTSMKGHSAIGMKADAVRLVGREGIKLITGGSPAFTGFGPDGETNSVGGRLEVAPPIELIAGYSVEPREVPATPYTNAQTIKRVQGVARGQNTRDALRQLGDLLEEVIGTLFSMALIQARFNSAAGLTLPWANPTVGAAAIMAGTAYSTKVLNPLYQTRINKIIWNINHLETYGYKYICSKNVYST
jgi:hypothetical protein